MKNTKTHNGDPIGFLFSSGIPEDPFSLVFAPVMPAKPYKWKMKIRNIKNTYWGVYRLHSQLIYSGSPAYR